MVGDIGLEVNDIGLFGALAVEDDNAAIVEVVADGGTLVVLNALPEWLLLPDVLEDDDRLVGAMLKELLIVGGNGDARQLHRLDALGYPRFPAACQQVFLGSYPIDDDGRLSPVGHAEIQAPQFAREPVVARKLLVGIIRPLLVDDIPHELIVSGRLDAKAPAMSPSGKPDELSVKKPTQALPKGGMFEPTQALPKGGMFR